MNGNDKLQNVRMRSTLKIFAAALIFAALTLGLYAAARWIPGFVDGNYDRNALFARLTRPEEEERHDVSGAAPFSE